MQYFSSVYVKSAKMGLFEIVPSIKMNNKLIPKVLKGIRR